MIMERFKKAANIQRGAKYKGGLDKLPAEAEIFTSETFRYEAAKPGDYVVEAVVDEAINCWPFSRVHAHKWGGHSHREDPKTSRWRARLRYFRAMPRYARHLEIPRHCFRVRRWSVARIRSAAERFVL